VPLYEFECVKCHRRVEKFFYTYDAMIQGKDWECRQGGCTGFLQKLMSAVAFHVRGFSSANGYSGGQTYEVKTKEEGVRVMVKS